MEIKTKYKGKANQNKGNLLIITLWGMINKAELVQTVAA